MCDYCPLDGRFPEFLCKIIVNRWCITVKLMGDYSKLDGKVNSGTTAVSFLRLLYLGEHSL